MTPSQIGQGLTPSQLLSALAAATLAAFLLSLSVGPAGFGLDIAGDAGGLILTEVRLPRAILGAVIGGSLGLAGAALQGYLRNPLAEPSLVGVSGGAALGAVLAIQLGLSSTLALALPAGGLR